MTDTRRRAAEGGAAAVSKPKPKPILGIVQIAQMVAERDAAAPRYTWCLDTLPGAFPSIHVEPYLGAVPPEIVITAGVRNADGRSHVLNTADPNCTAPYNDLAAYVVDAVNEAGHLASFVQLADRLTRQAIDDNKDVSDDAPEWHYLACARDLRRRLGLPE